MQFKIELSQEFGEKQIYIVLSSAICIQIAPFLFLKAHILNLNFYAILFIRNQDKRIPKISGKSVIIAPLVKRFSPKNDRHQFVFG